jgi:GNAT superfamily N-acetyltransferase
VSETTPVVRAAASEDVPGIVGAVQELLVELGATPPPAQEMQETTRGLIADPAAGAVLVAEADGVLVGVLAASWQSAIHVPGRYALIQDLWVHPSFRSRAIGAALLAALLERALELGMARFEVGLPKESFAGLDSTEAFYRSNGFSSLGPRMRRALS